ncbi:sensor histidine kinase [Nocardiopsis quinghaiensis]|uniref:sensor histidine kinase n=1 Tax=Nocardiopsis quinghaiensis TaxID=464995 RepID=UPI001CC2571E|nr:sensor histidine kinase [Nocardiopsis quinghaiensis]
MTASADGDGGPATAPLPGPVGARAPTEEHHAWNLGVWWDVYFTSVMAAMGALALLTSDPFLRWPLAGLMAAVVAVYYLFARRLLLQEERIRPVVLMGVLLALCLPALTANPVLAFVTVGVAPLCFMTARIPVAISTVGALLLAPALLRGLTGLSTWESTAVNLLINGVMVGFTLWFGSWLGRIIEQSYERSELIRELRESRVEAARLSEETGAMAERERLAREMHDTLAQGLASIIALTQAVESEMDTDPVLARRHLALMRETAAENLAEARAMVAARQPVNLDHGSLEAALERAAKRLGDELGIPVDTSVHGVPAVLSNALQICLLRTAQESLANARRHARAGHVRVALEYAHAADPGRATAGAVELTVTDDGVGFRPDEVCRGNGLVNMRHRADGVGGSLEVDSSPGHGTRVRMSLPLLPDPDRVRGEDDEEYAP